jgi:hypothetical protein
LLEQLAILLAAYEAGALGGTQHELYPDVSPGSRDRTLYFTFAPALNYQRKSEGLWRAALETYRDIETRFVFDPAEAGRGVTAYRRALTRYSLAIQPEKQTAIWYTIATSLNSNYGADPRNLFSECDYRVTRIKDLIVGRRRDFPYLSGPKLLNYWLYMISCFTTASFKEREAISIVPDLHVTRATIRLGLAAADELRGPKDVERVWRAVLSGTGLAACDLHAPLWRWSRAGLPEVESMRHYLHVAADASATTPRPLEVDTSTIRPQSRPT